jgi:outer membrane protein
MRNKAFYLLFILVYVSLASFAQTEHNGPWSLADCTNYALEHNITLQQSGLSVQQREVQLSGAKARRLPGVTASAGESFSFGRGLTSNNTYADNSNTTMTSFSVGASVPIFEGFTITNNIALNRLNLEAATVDLEKARDDIRVAVAQAFVQILYNKEILSVARNQIAVDSMQVVRLSTMLSNGKASSAEVSAAEATLAQSRLTATQAEGNLRIAILDLTQLIELPSPDGFDIVVPDVSLLPTEALTPPEVIYEEAMQVKPSIRSEQLRLQAAEKNIDIARGGYFPNISLNGGVGTNYYSIMGVAAPSFGTQLRDNFSPSLSLSLSVPIFDRFSTRTNVRSAKLSHLTQQLTLENAGKTLYKEIQQAYYNALTARRKYEGSLAAEKSASEAFDIMSAKYENNKANITEFNEAKNRLISASSDLAQARYQYLYQARLLDFYRGKEIIF